LFIGRNFLFAWAVPVLLFTSTYLTNVIMTHDEYIKSTKITTLGVILSVWASYTARNIVIAFKYGYYTVHEYEQARSTLRDNAQLDRFLLALWAVPSLARLTEELRYAAIEQGISFCDPHFAFSCKSAASDQCSQELSKQFEELMFPTERVRAGIDSLLSASDGTQFRKASPRISATVFCASLAYQAVQSQVSTSQAGGHISTICSVCTWITTPLPPLFPQHTSLESRHRIHICPPAGLQPVVLTPRWAPSETIGPDLYNYWLLSDTLCTWVLTTR
jgi:hypothetical protein